MASQSGDLRADTIASKFLDEFDLHGLDNPRFLPRGQLGQLTELSVVEQTIEKHCRGSNVTRLVEFSTENPRLFLICVLFKQVSSIPSLCAAGFTDGSLPVEGTAYASTIKSFDRKKTWNWKDFGNQDSPWDWDEKNRFLDYQWSFSAIRFKDNKFSFKISKKCPLPYIPLERATSKGNQGYFGEVHKVGLLKEHLEARAPRFFSLVESPCHSGQVYQVAVKKVRIEGVDPKEVENYFNKEKTTLRLMKDSNHKHLIDAIAVYERGTDKTDKYFVFPWATGGNLRGFWGDKAHSKGGSAFISWALHQMAGLASGLATLHKGDTRHGDIKPENILLFSGDGDSKGTLVLADVGIAKFHADHTSKRQELGYATTNKYGTLRYEPPEMEVRKDQIFSRKIDAWSMGCVLLEFSIWLLHGSRGQDSFNTELVETEPKVNRFWDADKEKVPRIHPVAKIWIKKLHQSAGKSSVLGDLLDLVESRLLVGDVDSRADSQEMHEKLLEIEKKCLTDPSYPLDRTSTMLIDHRETTTEVARDNLLPPSQQRIWVVKNRTSDLVDRWDTVTDTDLASLLFPRVDGPRLHSLVAHSPRLCNSCATIDFESSTYALQRSLQDLQTVSSDCLLCQFLYRRLSANGATPQGPLTLHRVGSTIRISPNGAPVISLYCDAGPDSTNLVHPYAQLGLPLLPEAASREQFTLLNSWIQICDDDHECVATKRLPAAYGTLPTRVIDVGDGDAKPMRLVETVQGSRDRYIALSHRWGDLRDDQKFCAYNGNFKSLKEVIPFDELPKSFQDAVRVTRALHIRYLWIDSLCIIQDNRLDWDSESKKMEDVFSNAYCTIAASSAESSLAGFLGPRPPRDAVSVQTPSGPLYLAESIDDFSSHVENSILSSRGWVLQERALSRRTIYFTNTQIYWECGRGVFCETLAVLRNPQSQFLGDSDFPSLGLRFYKDERIRLVQYLYQKYSGLSLSEISDRSKAIFGLQKRIARQFRSEAQYGVVWTWMERTLLWHAETPRSLTKIKYKPEGSVPSWSWMAYHGRIGFMEIPFRGVTWTDNIGHPTSQESEDAHWDGRLKVESSELIIKTPELMQRALLDRQVHDSADGSWRCVVVGKGKAPMDGDEVARYVLLIRQATKVEADRLFVRVGVATLLNKHVSSGTSSVFLI